MEIKEKIRKIYQKNNIIVTDKTIEVIMQDKKTTKGLMKHYKNEKIESMNYMFGKDRDNKYFTKQELEFACQFDLFNRKMIDKGKMIWENKDNYEQLKKFREIIKMEVNK